MSNHKQLSFKEHLQKRAFYGGSSECSEHDIWVWDTIWCKKTCVYSDALIDNIDEIRVNAMDHYYRSVNTPYPVTYIKFNINSDGMLSITNDGQGIPVIDQWPGKTGTGYLPQAIISEERSGSNFDDEKEPDRVTGGMNGLGMKITNAGSVAFQIETIDNIRRLKYIQECQDRMNIIKTPQIIATNSMNPYTKITWTPDYNNLCKITKTQSSQNWISENYETLMNIVRLMAYQTAVFIRSIEYRHSSDNLISHKYRPKVYFNDVEITITDITDFMKQFGLQDIVYIKFNDPDIHKFPWYIGIGLRRQLTIHSKQRAGLEHMSLVNGVYVGLGGSHVNLIVNAICAALKQYANTEISETMFNKVFCYFDCRQMSFNSYDFDSQTKNKITMGRQTLNALQKICIIPPKQASQIWSLAKDDLTWLLKSKDLKDQITSTRKNRQGHIRKYDKADMAGTKESYKCGCFIGEGDSACAMIRNMVKNDQTPIDKRYYGIYSIQGVPPNALKMVTQICDPTTNKSYFIGSHSLRENIALAGLVQALGLDYGHTYDLTSEGNTEFSKLNYGFMIMATDQDLDGIGHICSLVLVFVMTFWPNLVKRNFFRRFATPIIRVYGGKSVIDFYSEKEYENWVHTNFGDHEKVPSKYVASYYKGLSGHTREEVFDMGKKIRNNIFIMTHDNICNELMKQLYGIDTNDRKRILNTNIQHEYPIDTWNTQVIKISDHFNIESKGFQLYNMRRKLKSYIDGMIPTQRKAFCGGRKRFATNKSKAKVFQISGYIAEHMHYGHGDASMNKVIIKMAQNFVGSNNIPAYVAISDGFGDRTNGRSKTGGARYIDTVFNSRAMNIIFPPDDDALLDYCYEDGVMCEPKYYVPVIPVSILESETTTGTGWKIDIWAREFNTVISSIREMIIGKSSYDLYGKPWLRNSKMRCEIIDGHEICLGAYTYDSSKNIIHITELPLKVWSHSYCCMLLGVDPETGKSERKMSDGSVEVLRKIPYIKKISDDTNNQKVDITIWLEPNSYEKIQESYSSILGDPMYQYLRLYRYLTPNLNMINEYNYVQEFNNYNEILMNWFLIRRQLYIDRIERLIILYEIRIDFHSNRLRFIEADAKSEKEINIDSEFDDITRDKILSENGYVRFNKSALIHPGVIKNSKLHEMIYSIKADYSYISDITIRDKSKKSIEALRKQINDMNEDLFKLCITDWRDIWLSEIDKVVSVVERGLQTNWLYTDKVNNFSRG